MKVTNYRWRVAASCLFIVAALSGCGGGGGSVGIDGSGYRPDSSLSDTTVSGSINGFGSVIINGVHYNTDDADVYVKGQLVDELQLSVGDYVTLVGKPTTPGEGVAYEIHYQPRVSGKIGWIDVDLQQFGMLNQTIQIDSDTVFAGSIQPKSVFGLGVGSTVRVSGVTEANGVIRATGIKTIESESVEIGGLISSVDDQKGTVVVQGVTIDVSDMLSFESLKVGKNITVTGIQSPDGVQAQDVDFSMDFGKLRKFERNQIDGYVEKRIDDTHFLLQGFVVIIQSDTQFKRGTVEDITENQKVRIRGRISGEKSFVATSVELLRQSDVQIYGNIEEITETSEQSRRAEGIIRVSGKDFVISSSTVMQKSRDRYFNFNDFRIGDKVYISARSLNDSNVATRVSVQTQSEDFKKIPLQGFVEQVTEGTDEFFVNDIKVITSEHTKYVCRQKSDRCDHSMITVNRNVSVIGDSNDASLDAKTIIISHDNQSFSKKTPKEMDWDNKDAVKRPESSSKKTRDNSDSTDWENSIKQKFSTQANYWFKK